VDSSGLPVHFELSGGQVHDISYVEFLVKAEVVLADKDYDSQALRDLITSRQAQYGYQEKKIANGAMIILIGVYIDTAI
jgi:ethanolamine utilization protein EutA (predicted chaperonin)